MYKQVYRIMLNRPGLVLERDLFRTVSGDLDDPQVAFLEWKNGGFLLILQHLAASVMYYGKQLLHLEGLQVVALVEAVHSQD
jgi:hypothetical protein